MLQHSFLSSKYCLNLSFESKVILKSFPKYFEALAVQFQEGFCVSGETEPEEQENVSFFKI